MEYGGRQMIAMAMSLSLRRDLTFRSVSSLDRSQLFESLLALFVVPGMRQHGVWCPLGINLDELSCTSVKDSDTHEFVRAFTNVHRHITVSKAKWK